MAKRTGAWWILDPVAGRKTAPRRKKKPWSINGMERVRDGTYKFFVTTDTGESLRVVVYPGGRMQVLGDGPDQWFQSDLPEAFQKELGEKVPGSASVNRNPGRSTRKRSSARRSSRRRSSRG